MKTHRPFALLAALLLLGSVASAAPARRQQSPERRAQVSRQSAKMVRETAARTARREAELRSLPDDGSRQLDGELRRRADRELGGRSQVIVELKPGYEGLLKNGFGGGRFGRRLRSFNGQVVTLPNGLLKRLARHPAVLRVYEDRPVTRHLTRASWTVGARAVHQRNGFTGAGIGVAVVDSGITAWHDDLTGSGAYPYGNQRVLHFVDLVANQTTPYDDHGHGTHVAGIIAGNGYDSDGQKMGIAPGAGIVAIKALDGNGNGTISNIIAAIDYAIANKAAYNIRVMNLSVGAGVYETYETDPLTLAAKRAVDAGIVVVAAAGNLGRNATAESQYGGITSPGNAPWVLTVGASSTEGTASRSDDTIAGFSSRGPTAIDYLAKPDLVAPGTGMVSASDPNSLLYLTKPQALLSGSVPTAYLPYLSLSGTSMAAPVVAGSVALMLEANPSLTPNLVKAILQYTSQARPQYDFLTQGAGFLNTRGAVRLARFFAHPTPGAGYPISRYWSRQRWPEGKVLSRGPEHACSAWNSMPRACF